MKKILAMILALAMALSLVACGQEAADNGGDAKDGKEYKVAMICDSSINDGGWGAACYNAMVSAADKMGWTYEVTDSIAQNEYYDSIVAYCALGYDMIYAPGNQYTDAVLQAAEEYPDIAFALLNGGADTPAKAVNKNVSSLLPDAQQIGWIAGALAGLMTKSGTIAFIGGMELDTTKGKYAGFGEAAKYVAQQEGKDVKLLDCVYAGSFDDSAKGMEFAKTMIEQGADVFFGDASAVDSGARQAIDEYNTAAGEVKVVDIAQPADILGQNECIICSQCTDNAAMISASMQAVQDGNFGGETLYGSLQNGALSAGAMSDLVPKDIQDKYQSYIQAMMDGTFMK
ncbi:MAG: BMP family ABC transporter substrate-binding protein [Clostridiales bacterium]|nr:BMP family ABC transporter substrate-binding protein [Candidatus Cacconaster stercorequi]